MHCFGQLWGFLISFFDHFCLEYDLLTSKHNQQMEVSKKEE